MSVVPPGANGTIHLIGFDGHAWAIAPGALSESANARHTIAVLIIVSLLVCQLASRFFVFVTYAPAERGRLRQLVNFGLWSCCRPFEKIEIAALIGLRDVLLIERTESPLVAW